MSEPTYFTAVGSVAARFSAVGRRLAFRAQTPAEMEIWRRELRAGLRRVSGLDTFCPAPLEPRVTERVELDGYARERVELQTEPGVIMPLYVLVPHDLQPGQRRAAVIAPHGHASGGKLAVAGRRDIPPVARTIAEYNYDYGVQLVRRGFVVFCPDARGFGERREALRQGEANLLASSCDLLNHIAIPLGQALIGMWIWDLMRLVDYVETRPECDPACIGCAGLSGGGTQTLWLAALDERIRAAVISGYFYGAREALLLLPDNCACDYVPGLWELADIGDMGALIAPRPLFVETGTRDPLNSVYPERFLANCLEQVAIARQAYSLLGAAELLQHGIFEGAHRWHGIDSIPFLERHLQHRDR